MAKGLDCGTSYYIAATDKSIKKQRNVFLTVDGDANQVKRMLKRQRIPFVEKRIDFDRLLTFANGRSRGLDLFSFCVQLLHFLKLFHFSWFS